MDGKKNYAEGVSSDQEPDTDSDGETLSDRDKMILQRVERPVECDPNDEGEVSSLYVLRGSSKKEVGKNFLSLLRLATMGKVELGQAGAGIMPHNLVIRPAGSLPMMESFDSLGEGPAEETESSERLEEASATCSEHGAEATGSSIDGPSGTKSPKMKKIS